MVLHTGQDGQDGLVDAGILFLDHEVRVDRRHAATMRERKRLRKVRRGSFELKVFYVEFPGERSF